MKIQYASDLHLEFPLNKEFLKNNPLKPIGEILVLAGDIVPFAVMEMHDDFFSYVSDHFEETYWIPGNHEYYYSDIVERSGVFHEMIKENVHLLNNTLVKHREVDLICSTLWSNISAANQWRIENSLNDFHVIKCNDDKFTTHLYNQLHKESVEFITNSLNETNGKCIVLSHHAPTLYNYPEKYKGDALNDAFAVELYDLIESIGPDVWIYGHTHGNTSDFAIANTRVVTNQLGYVKYNEHGNFNNAISVHV